MSAAFRRDFPLDGFQRDAIAALDAGRNVLVAAPTGAGKTVVAEHAVALAVASGTKCFYTAPIKALSNQKFADLRRELGEANVGLLTGDHSINSDAPVVVMTTEVLRNMVYAASSALDGLRWVVLDEVHFLQDAYRGPVWEEVLVHTPASVGFVCLSATVSNALELGEWIETLRGPTDTVIEHQRPIRLDPLMLVGDRSAEREHLVPLLVQGRPNPEGHRFDVDRPMQRGPRGRPRSRFFTPRRTETVERLDDEGLLPAIYFIFSRNACDDAARNLMLSGVRLTDAAERRRIHEIAEYRTRSLVDEDLDVLGYDSWLSTLESGAAAHHAGMIPAFRETVEDCFNEGLLKVVFATETLALGINMPARAVVIEKLSKYNGEGHEFLTPAQFTQLTGRAGRRGLDDSGSAIVLWSPFTTFDQVATLAASREFPLSSSFRPTYNMTANLVDRYDRERAHEVLSRSFAQFQADRAVVRMEARRARLSEELASLELGLEGRTDLQVMDVEGYAAAQQALRDARRDARGSARDVEQSLGRLRPGDVIERRNSRGAQLLVVLAVSHRRGGSVKVRTTSTAGRPVNLDPGNVEVPLVALTHVDLPVPYKPQDPSFRRAAAQMLRRVNTKRLDRSAVRALDRSAVNAAREVVESHPMHHHPDREQLLAGHRSIGRLRDELARMDRDARRRGSGLVRQFESVLAVLERTGHVEQWALTDAGARLRRIYHECDLLISMALGEGLFDGLDDAEVAALASCCTYEHRSSEPPPPPLLPSAELRTRVARLEQLSERLGGLESAQRLPITRSPDAGFAAAAWSWASGQDLHLILDEDLTGGDFVRNVRQLIDLLRQIGDVAPLADTGAAARRAAETLTRGVILSTGSIE